MNLGTIALVCAAGLLGPALSLLARNVVPVVVGELLAGVMLGKTGFGIVDPGRSDLSLLYSLGFAMLMFTVGMRIPLHDRRLRSALGSGARAAAAAVPLALAAGLACHAAGGGPTLVYAVVIASSSAAVALPIIDESGLSTPPVLAAISWITIADVLATLAIPLALTPSRAGHAALGALIVAALAAAAWLAVDRLRHLTFVRRAREDGKQRGWAIDLRLAVIALVGLGYVAQKVGASLLVAGFGIGLLVAAIGGPKRLSKEVLGLGQGFFIPVFFVLLGAKLDLRALIDSDKAIVLAILLSALTLVVHVLAAISIRAPKAVGLLASAQIGVPAAVIALGLQAHAIQQAQASAIFCAALFSIGASAAGAALLRRPADSADTAPATA